MCCSHRMEEGRRRAYGGEPEEYELREDFRRPRDSILSIAALFWTTCHSRLRQLRKILADPSFRPPELLDHKTHNVSPGVSGVMISSGWYLCALNQSPYALHPTSEVFPALALRWFFVLFDWRWLSLILDDCLSSFQGKLLCASSFCTSRLQAIDSVMSFVVCAQVVSQAPPLVGVTFPAGLSA